MTLFELLKLMRKHLKLVITLPIVFALVTAAYAWVVMPNQYTASVSMYVLTKSSSDSSNSLTNSDLSASQMLTNDVATLMKSDRVLNDTAKALQMSSLKGYKISVESSTTTRVLTVSVTGEDPSAVAVIANQLASTSDSVAQEVMDVRSVNAINQAEEPTSPSGPPRAMYTAVAFLAGLFVAIAIVVILDMANTRVRSAEEVEELLGMPVIGRIPAVKN